MKLSNFIKVLSLLVIVCPLKAQNALKVRQNDTTSHHLMVEPLLTNSGAFFGENAGKKNMGFGNSFFGYTAGEKNTIGVENTFMGMGAGQSNRTGTHNTYIGKNTGSFSNGSRNVFMGVNSGQYSPGSDNLMLGYQAGIFGTGSRNVLLGVNAGQYSSGTDNVILGYQAGSSTAATGSRNVFIGKEAGMNESGSNKLYIENSNVDSTNALLYGNFSTDYLRTKSRMEVYSHNSTTPAFVAIKAYNAGVSPSDHPGVLGQNNVDDSWGIGVKGIGGYIGVVGTTTGTGGGTYFGMIAEATTPNTGSNYGLYANATGSAANVAIYATAPLGAPNYAGFFEGRVYVGNILGIGRTPATFPLEIKSSSNNLIQFYNENTARWHMRIENNNALSFTETAASANRLTFLPGGNIGMGIALPTTSLHIYSPTEPTLKLQSDGTAENSGRISLRQSDNTGMDLYYDGINDDYVVESYTNGASIGKRLIIDQASGDVGIGTSDMALGYKLSVDGMIICTNLVMLPQESWPDYVFAKGYDLMSLEKVQSHIEKHHHLPGIPSATEIAEDGVNVGQMQTLMMKKIEELTLYVIDLNEQMKELKAENVKLRSEVLTSKD